MKPMESDRQKDEMTIEETLAAIDRSTILNQFTSLNMMIDTKNLFPTPTVDLKYFKTDLGVPLPLRQESPRLTTKNAPCVKNATLKSARERALSYTHELTAATKEQR